ncbi:Gfo/Idh/MocA family oxidoreductase [Polaromonas sp. P2-4]|nr:Gfo/Idh/MocA family oxidoreductase [Polaromonas sp. P2-4]
MKPISIGVIGCGNISDAYFTGAARSELVRVKACADLNHAAAQAKAGQHGVAAVSVEQLLADPEISIVINLTIPRAHAPVALQILDAGKHVYLEKPLAATLTEARVDGARRCQGFARRLRTRYLFGAAHQACRRVVDSGQIGKPIGGSVAVLSHGMETWHPNPEFFFKPGGGLILDMGPYYIAQLVNLLGPVARVAACTTIGNATRTVTSEPLNGQVIQVEVPTTMNGVL